MNALFAVARAIHRVIQFKVPARAIAVIGSNVSSASWPPLLQAQLPALPGLLRVTVPNVGHAPALDEPPAQAALDAFRGRVG